MPMAMRRSTSWGIATLLTAAGLAAGCSGGGSAKAGSTGNQGTVATGGPASSAPAPTTSTSTAPPPLSVDDFKKRLVDINGVLAPDFTAVGKAKGGKDISAALDKLADDANSQLQQIPDNPPRNVASASGELSDALKDLGSAASDEKGDAGSKVCAGGSAAAALSRSDGAGKVRTAAQHLAAADPAYADVLTFLPAPIQDQKRQLASGTVLRKGSGPGKLTIHTADEDAVVTLTRVGSKTPVASVYVRASSTTDLHNVPGATLEAYISYGTDWDNTAKAFTRDCAFSKADSTFDFSDSDWELTLYKVANGNLTEIPVDPNNAPPP
ncbi:hypothetical protein [Catenulispora subtropica]|uniref:Lipoprotein n=1 Tax=Catenulispora subtropica TaxID=450798 RepID=A0ABN2SZR2_9ACTN